MNSALKKKTVAAINNQWIKGSKDMVMGYANKYFFKLMDWIYFRYGQIAPRYLRRIRIEYKRRITSKRQ